MIKYSSCHKVAVEEFPEIPHYVCPKCAQPCEVVEPPSSQQPTISPDQPDSDRLLTENDIEVKDFLSASGFDSCPPELNLLLRQQRDLTYPLAFEAGRESLRKELAKIKHSCYKAGVSDGQYTNHKRHGQQFRDYEAKIRELEVQAEKDRAEIEPILESYEKTCGIFRHEVRQFLFQNGKYINLGDTNEAIIKAFQELSGKDLSIKEQALSEAEKRGARALIQQIKMNNDSFPNSDIRLSWSWLEAKLKSLEER